nr:molybdenum cofactor guanylyltransferase [Acidisarcina polymorpha]
MGSDKAFLRIGDEFLLERQLRCLRACGAQELLISGRPDVNYSRFDARTIHDQEPDCGPIGGLAAVLPRSSQDLVLLLAVDMPAMTPAMLHKILCKCTSTSGCVPMEGERYQPLAAVYPKGAQQLIESHLAQGKYSMQGFVRDALEAGLVQSLPLESSEVIYFTNWNQPSDWQSQPPAYPSQQT